MVAAAETPARLLTEPRTPKQGAFIFILNQYEIKHQLPGMGRETQKAAKGGNG